MSLVRRVPKFGFKNFNRVEYKGINLDVLQQLAEKTSVTVITREVLIQSGLVSKNDRIKILGRGELKARLDITVHAFSATAKKAIEELGGVANTL
jgi:large subunit ribosomal protein L15